MSTKKTFEENLQDLDAIVTKLETGDVALEDAIAMSEYRMHSLYGSSRVVLSTTLCL